MERGFEKIGYEEFKKAVADDKNLYDSIVLPKRKTGKSAGYDFIAFRNITIKPGEIVKIPTGYKVKLQDNEFLMLVVRSSMGFKYNIRLCNQVGIIDADYYNNESNEGHMYVALQNEGDKEFVINAGDAYVQGIILNYLTCGEENNVKRTGGIGSTNKEG